jgi:hypothetical protein
MIVLMKKTTVKIHLQLLLLLAGWVAPAGAGTEVKARLESYSYKEAWVAVDALVTDERLRLDFQGPWSHGSLIYDRESSQLTVVDDLHQTVLPLSQENQAALKLVGAIASGKLQGETAGSAQGAKAYQIFRENARAFFNGIPALKGKGIRKDDFICDDYWTDLEGKKAREVWVATPEQTGMSGGDYNTLRSLVHLVLDFCEGPLTQLGADTALFREGFSNPQVPVREVLYANGKPSVRFQVLGIHSRAFDARTFEPPAGYWTLSLLDVLENGFQAKH